MRIAMVSLYASPLAMAGEVDCGDQSQHVGELSAALARLGHDVTVYTRRMEPAPPDTVLVGPGLAVEQIQAGLLGSVAGTDPAMTRTPVTSRMNSCAKLSPNTSTVTGLCACADAIVPVPPNRIRPTASTPSTARPQSARCDCLVFVMSSLPFT